MGFHVHKTIVVSCDDRDKLCEAHAKAREIFGVDAVSDTADAPGSVATFIVLPTNSDCGKTRDRELEPKREEFLRWLEHYRAQAEPLDEWVFWAFIEYGHEEDCYPTQVLADSCRAGWRGE